MSIPRQLTYSLQKMSDFSKNTYMTKPLNKDSFDAGEYITLRLPTNKTIDLHSLAILFDATPTLGVLPKYASSLIGKLEVSQNGTLIDGGGLTEYNTTYNMFATSCLGEDKHQEQAVYSNAVDITAAPSSAGTKKSLTIDNFLGFLGGNFCRYIHTGMVGQLEIRIQLASNSVVAPTAAAAGGQKFSVEKVRLYVEQMEFGDDWFRKSIEKALSEAPLLLPYKQFRSFGYSISSTAGSCQTALGTESLDAVYGFLRPGDYDSVANTVVADYGNVKNSHFFTQTAAGGKFKWRINHIQYPMFDVEAHDAYTLLKNTINGGGMNAAYTNSIGDSTQWANGKFVFSHSFKFHSDEPLNRLQSGLNTMTSQVPLEFSFTDATNVTHRPFFVVETTPYLRIEQGQIVTPVP